MTASCFLPNEEYTVYPSLKIPQGYGYYLTLKADREEEAVIIREMNVSTPQLSVSDLAAVARRINDYCRKPLHEINEETSVTHGEMEIFFIHHLATEAAQGGDHYGDRWEMIEEITEDFVEVTCVQTLDGDEMSGAAGMIQEVLN